MKKLFFILFIFIGCSKPVTECWKCEVRYQTTDELIEEIVFCDKDWIEIINIASGLNTENITYTHCKKRD